MAVRLGGGSEVPPTLPLAVRSISCGSGRKGFVWEGHFKTHAPVDCPDIIEQPADSAAKSSGSFELHFEAVNQRAEFKLYDLRKASNSRLQGSKLRLQ
jgi:hypothetical protein